MIPLGSMSIEGPPSEANNCSMSWMKVSGPSKVTLSIFGVMSILAPVENLKAREVKCTWM